MVSVSSVTATAAAASAAVPQGAKTVAAQAVKQASWVRNLPTRAIANVLLESDSYMASHDALYHAVDKTGLLRSRRHFKHCLRMMSDQKRVKVFCIGPEKVGSAKLKFSVKLTSRGRTIYGFYRRGTLGSLGKVEERAEGEQPGLKDALP